MEVDLLVEGNMTTIVLESLDNGCILSLSNYPNSPTKRLVFADKELARLEAIKFLEDCAPKPRPRLVK